ncbi:MAG: hypothetical protein ACP5U0_09525 [Caldisphaera sp.]
MPEKPKPSCIYQAFFLAHYLFIAKSAHHVSLNYAYPKIAQTMLIFKVSKGM